MKTLLTSLACGLMLAGLAPAITLLEVTRTSGPISSSPAVGDARLSGTVFTLSQSYTNVRITGWLGTSGAMYPPAEIYLTTAIGPGTTVADEVDSVAVAYPVGGLQETLFFDNLSLDAGTYYLTLKTPVQNATDLLQFGVGNVVTTAPGVTHDVFVDDFSIAPYAPASGVFTFDAGYFYRVKVTGDVERDPAGVPEPGTVVAGIGLTAGIVVRSWRGCRA